MIVHLKGDDGGELVARVPREAVRPSTEKVEIRIATGRIDVFDPATGVAIAHGADSSAAAGGGTDAAAAAVAAGGAPGLARPGDRRRRGAGSTPAAGAAGG